MEEKLCPSCQKCFCFDEKGVLTRIKTAEGKVAEGFEHFVLEEKKIPPACKTRHGRCLARECVGRP